LKENVASIQRFIDKSTFKLHGFEPVKKFLHEFILDPIRFPWQFEKPLSIEKSSILIFGAAGTGKTAILRYLLEESQFSFYYKWLQPSDWLKEFSDDVINNSFHFPMVLVFDPLEWYTPAQTAAIVKYLNQRPQGVISKKEKRKRKRVKFDLFCFLFFFF